MPHPTLATGRAADVLEFWFGTADAAARGIGFDPRWFQKDPSFDEQIRRRFGQDLDAAARGQRDHWAATPAGLLALCIVLDQFSRNVYRGNARAWAADPYIRARVHRGVNEGMDRVLGPTQKGFLYLPFEHSEDPADHARALDLFGAMAASPDPEEARLGAMYLDYEEKHLAIIERFGRYPHRNAVLGRPSTAEERVFLTRPGSSF
jgi:uncharacterized protein (DUF924 family)